MRQDERLIDENQDSVPVGDDVDSITSLKVENFHYSPNSLTELRKIADSNPELAEKIVDSQSRAARWYGISEIVGFAVAALVAVAVIAGFVFIVVHLGWWQSAAFLVLMLCISHLLRTMLTGEWSDTSWFGQIFKKAGAPPTDADAE